MSESASLYALFGLTMVRWTDRIGCHRPAVLCFVFAFVFFCKLRLSIGRGRILRTEGVDSFRGVPDCSTAARADLTLIANLFSFALFFPPFAIVYCVRFLCPLWCLLRVRQHRVYPAYTTTPSLVIFGLNEHAYRNKFQTGYVLPCTIYWTLPNPPFDGWRCCVRLLSLSVVVPALHRAHLEQRRGRLEHPDSAEHGARTGGEGDAATANLWIHLNRNTEKVVARARRTVCPLVCSHGKCGSEREACLVVPCCFVFVVPRSSSCADCVNMRVAPSFLSVVSSRRLFFFLGGERKSLCFGRTLNVATRPSESSSCSSSLSSPEHCTSQDQSIDRSVARTPLTEPCLKRKTNVALSLSLALSLSPSSLLSVILFYVCFVSLSARRSTLSPRCSRTTGRSP